MVFPVEAEIEIAFTIVFRLLPTEFPLPLYFFSLSLSAFGLLLSVLRTSLAPPFLTSSQ